MAGGFRSVGIAAGAGGLLALAGAAIAFPPARIAPAASPAARPAPPVAAEAPLPAPADTGFVLKGVLALDRPLELGDYTWDDEGVPPGPIVITVDLAAQTLSVFRGGYEIGTAAILYGVDGNPTPLGRFAITEKDRDHRSNLYEADMPYMLRLTNDGVAIHGSDVVEGSATRGCIGVPVPFAALLFAQARLGDPVLITDGARLHLGDRIALR